MEYLVLEAGLSSLRILWSETKGSQLFEVYGFIELGGELWIFVVVVYLLLTVAEGGRY